MAALKCYIDTCAKLHDGLDKALLGRAKSADPAEKKALALWQATAQGAGTK